jgi:hypothetical protein
MPEPWQSRLSIAARLGILWCTVMHSADVADPRKLSMPQVSPDLY